MTGTYDERTLKDIIRESIKQGKLFELIFSEDGRRLWRNWKENKMKEFVRKPIKKEAKEDEKTNHL